MTTIKSNPQTVGASAEKIFETLSDFRNLEKVKSKISHNINDLEIDADTLRVSVAPLGAVVVRVKEREPFKRIKYVSEKSIVPFELQINLTPVSEEKTNLQIQLDAEIPMMVKMMFGNKLNEFVERFAEQLAKITY
jgi:carbon monoxide dehydrogenase subunit G